MTKEKKILLYFIFYLLGLLTTMIVGISDVFALVVNSSFMGTSIGSEFSITSGSYKSANTSITVDESNALNYLVVDICSTMHGSYSISNISNQSGNVSFYKGYYISGTCALANYNGAHIRLYYKVNSWADAGNGNYGVVFTSRFNNIASYPGYVKVNSIYTLDTLDSTVANIEQSDKLNSSIQNSTDTITGSITDSENNITNSITDSQDNINQNIDDMEDAIVDSNKETQEVIKDQFNTCRDSVNIWDNSSFITNSSNITKTETGFTYTRGDETGSKYVLLQIDVKNGETYTFTADGASYANGSSLYIYKNVAYGEIIKAGYSSITGTSNFDGKMAFTIIIDANTQNLEISNIQVEKGSSKTSYEHYGEICSNKLDEQNETSKGIWQTLKDLPGMFLDMLKGLFIPDDLSFIDEFKDVISNKLGFIASIPIQIIDFTLELANVAFEEITSISLPSISIFGFYFWDSQEIDITILLDKLKPFKYFTDFTCVILCCRTLYNWYHSFTGGDAN